VNHVAHAADLGLQVPGQLLAVHAVLAPPGQGHHGDALDNPHFPGGALDGADLVRVVRQQPDAPLAFPLVLVGVGAAAQVLEDGSGEAVGAGVGRVAQQQVGLDGVVAEVLQIVGLELAGEADAAALLAQVDDDAAGGGGVWVGGAAGAHEAGGFVELFAAVAAGGPGGLAGVAFAVDADEGRFEGVQVVWGVGRGGWHGGWVGGCWRGDGGRWGGREVGVF